MPVAYWILKAVLSPVFFLLWRVKTEGREHIPAHGPAVLAANHQSFCDSFFLPLVLRRRVTYVAKAEYFDNWKHGLVLPGRRADPHEPRWRRRLPAGPRHGHRRCSIPARLLGIYPEGTRAPDLRLHKGHTGVARLSLRCDVPIIPVGIVGTRAVQPPGSNLMRPFHSVTIRFGPPLTYMYDGKTITTGACADPDDQGQRTRLLDQAELRALTDTLMAEIARLSGQEYVDHYATRAKAG